jgi:hypothetical protein
MGTFFFLELRVGVNIAQNGAFVQLASMALEL